METKNNVQQNEVIGFFSKFDNEKRSERKKLERVLHYTHKEALENGKFSEAGKLMRTILVRKLIEVNRIIQTNPAAQKVVIKHLCTTKNTSC